MENVYSLPMCPGCGWVIHEGIEFMAEDQLWHEDCAQRVADDLAKVFPPNDQRSYLGYYSDDEIWHPGYDPSDSE